MTEKLSKNEDFIKLVSLSGQKKQELYDQELVLRFVAFLGNADKINANTEIFLDKFMETAVKDKEFDVGYYEELFVKVMRMLRDAGDSSMFRNDRKVNSSYFIAVLLSPRSISTLQTARFKFITYFLGRVSTLNPSRSSTRLPLSNSHLFTLFTLSSWGSSTHTVSRLSSKSPKKLIIVDSKIRAADKR